VIHTLPRALRARAVVHPQDDARDELHRDRKRERAAPNVAPARAAGNVLIERQARQPTVAGACIEPIEERFHATGVFSFTPALKVWKSTHTSPPARISTASVSSPRAAGLAPMISPSWPNALLWQGQKNWFVSLRHSTAQPRCGHAD